MGGAGAGEVASSKRGTKGKGGGDRLGQKQRNLPPDHVPFSMREEVRGWSVGWWYSEGGGNIGL